MRPGAAFAAFFDFVTLRFFAGCPGRAGLPAFSLATTATASSRHSRMVSGSGIISRSEVKVRPTVSVNDRRTLSLAYTPGVAEVCLAIAADAVLAVQHGPTGTEGHYQRQHQQHGRTQTQGDCRDQDIEQTLKQPRVR